jgi:hypothetical protein
MSVLSDKRRQLDEATTLAIAQTVEITDLLRDRPVPEIAFQLRNTMPAVSNTFGTVGAIISVDSYNKFRNQARLPSKYTAEPVIPDTDKAMQAAIGFGMAQLTKGVPFDTFQATLAGSVQRLVLDGDRGTTEFNIVTDPDGTEYERVPQPNACAFCLTMAAVAEVRRESYFEGYHNFCKCTVRPIFRGQQRTKLPVYKQVNDAYSLADKELLRQRKAVGYDNLKRREAAAKYPDLVLNTPNHLRLMRQITGWK